MGQAADSDFTPVMVRLTATQLETVDTLITVGIASSRAEAIRWALTRIRAWPAYAELLSRAREIERLRAEF
jgi:Arc/MetJ-type ribon-helix-helix transcriptional regulator